MPVCRVCIDSVWHLVRGFNMKIMTGKPGQKGIFRQERFVAKKPLLHGGHFVMARDADGAVVGEGCPFH